MTSLSSRAQGLSPGSPTWTAVPLVTAVCSVMSEAVSDPVDELQLRTSASASASAPASAAAALFLFSWGYIVGAGGGGGGEEALRPTLLIVEPGVFCESKDTGSC